MAEGSSLAGCAFRKCLSRSRRFGLDVDDLAGMITCFRVVQDPSAPVQGPSALMPTLLPSPPSPPADLPRLPLNVSEVNMSAPEQQSVETWMLVANPLAVVCGVAILLGVLCRVVRARRKRARQYHCPQNFR